MQYSSSTFTEIYSKLEKGENCAIVLVNICPIYIFILFFKIASV